jgi:hypothetical protein
LGKQRKKAIAPSLCRTWLLAAALASSACPSGFRPVDAGAEGGPPAAEAASADRRSEAAPGEGPPASGWTLVYEDPQAQPGESLNALWLADPGAVFAAGDNGQIVHYDGSNWTALNKTAGAHYQGLHGRSATDVTAVGIYSWNGAPAILHYDGKIWAPPPVAIPSHVKGLTDLWTAGTQTYYVGLEGRIYQDDPVVHPTDRYHLAAETGSCPLRTDPAPILWAIDGSGLDNLLVAGERGLLAHFDLKGWMRLCHPDVTVSYRAVFRIPGSADLMLGASYFGLYRFVGRAQPTTVIHEDRASAGADKLHLWAIWGTGPASLLAVGDKGTILYWDGGPKGARRLPSPTTEPLFGVWGHGPDLVYICGAGNRIWRGKLP